jgi:prevent-host-death family protein
MTTLSSSEARASLPELLDRVAAGEEVTITRHGRPVAVVVRPEALRLRRADKALGRADELRRALEAARRKGLTSPQGLTSARAEALIAEVRDNRRRR